MKIAIVYYSKTGNTKNVALILGGYLQQKAQVEYIEVRGKDEPVSFFRQCREAFAKEKAELALDTRCDLSSFDAVCFGSPVWAFAPAPVMNAYLDTCCGLEGKTVVLFTTSGGMGDKRCIRHMQALLASKGVKGYQVFSLSQEQAHNKDAVVSKIKQAISL